MNKHQWIDEERDIVRRDYNGHNKTSELIANKLGVTLYAVKGQAARMGIMQDRSPNWSEKEIVQLTEMIPRYSITWIACKLNRSVNAVVVKSKRLGLSRRIRDGWFTKKEICEIFGVDHKKIQKYIDIGRLKASYHTNIKPQKNGGACWHIKKIDLKDFISNYIGDFQGRNVDLNFILWILTDKL